ncbi:4512_t:CDS:2, partial [Gigaspora margarita]
MDFVDIIEPDNIIDSEDIMDSENIESDILDRNEDFILLPKNLAQRYSAKCTYCDQIFEAHKEAIANHIINSYHKILAENRILYSRIIKNKPEQVTESSMHKAVLITDHFDKATMLLEKVDELHTLLLQALIYSNIAFSFVENLFFILFVKNLYPSYNPLSRYTLTHRILQSEYAQIL